MSYLVSERLGWDIDRLHVQKNLKLEIAYVKTLLGIPTSKYHKSSLCPCNNK